MTDQTQRDKMLQRVLNLRAKADNDGASEAEMNSAFTMAQKLMDSYNIQEAELAIAEAEGRIVLEIVKKVSDSSALLGKRQRHKVVTVLSAIAAFTSTKVVYNPSSGDITFVGHLPDVELANYIVAVCREALDREYDRYRSNNSAVGYGAKTSFQIAMARRISSRLYKMKEDADDKQESDKQEALKIENASTASSTALVISELAEQKEKETAEAYAKAFPRVSKGSGFSGGRNYSAHSAGTAAGNNVNFGKAVTSMKQKKIA